MRKHRWRFDLLVALSLITFASLMVRLGSVSAQAACGSSAAYQLSQCSFGSGGELSQTSASYQAMSVAGELGVGNSSSANYQTQAGFNTSDIPVLELSVSGGVFDLGQLSTSSTASTSTTFGVRSYLSKGYTVELVGSPPANNGNHILSALNSPTAAAPGTEQFGVNLVANTTPNVGANPVQLPDSTFSFGAAASGYNTANRFKFASGDTIATSNSSSGTTLYTLSSIVDISPATPAGVYGELNGLYGGALYVLAIPAF